ncbi:MAG: prenyltransferase [Nannocystaceae bacterium]|nr:prenyltransferase [bacterium]
MKLSSWVQAARPLAHANIAAPLLVGEVLGWAATGQWDLRLVVLTHVAAVLDQLFIVFANDVADEASDRHNDDATPFSGGSRVLVEGKISSAALRRASWGAAVALLGLAAFMAFGLARPLLFPLWVGGIALLWAYSYPPLRLSYRGYGEVAQGLGLGVVLPLVGYYTVAGSFEGLSWQALVPLFVLGFAGNINTALPDARADAATEKRSWPVRYGLSRARKHTLQLLGLATFMTPFVLSDAPQSTWFSVEVGPALVLLLAAVSWRDADPGDRRACVRFVFLCGFALNLLMVGWCGALWIHAAV